MTDAQKMQALAAFASLLGLDNIAAPVAKPKGKFVSKIKRFEPKLSPAVVNAKTERQLTRFVSVAKAFNRKGIKNSEFTLRSKADGGSDTVKTYRDWQAAGFQVKRGQHGVKGLFHVSQVEPLMVNVEPVTVPQGQTALTAMG